MEALFFSHFQALREGGGLVGCVQSEELHLMRFILLGSFSDTLLVVSILVYDCHL